MIKIKITDFYDEFRPFNETEAKEAIYRVADNDRFYEIYKYFFPECKRSELSQRLLNFDSVYDFQKEIMQKILKQVIELTTDGFSFSGLENIDPSKNYVFISNHRDIVLDAGFFQSVLIDHGIETTEVTFGNNLMNDPLVYDIGKINKMFKVYRKGSPKELLRKTIQLSEYIHYTIFNKKRSVWIAQRGGRTKDGNDKTQSGIIKMLNSSGTDTLIENIKKLNIIPLTISYEFEPNDHLKVKELLNTTNGKYIKTESEDIKSIIDGVIEHKGRVNLVIGKSINDELDRINTIQGRNKQITKIAEIIDNRIYRNYKFLPNNYIAYDILNNTDRYKASYTEKERTVFTGYMEGQLEKVGQEPEKAKELFLTIYSNPLENFNRTS
jgi:hypothetical protein